MDLEALLLKTKAKVLVWEYDISLIEKDSPLQYNKSEIKAVSNNQ